MRDRQRSASARITGVQTFSVTKLKERDALGERITQWVQSHRDAEIIRTEVVQSSDAEFHCLSIVIFYGERSVVADVQCEGASEPALE